jgi:hypothetical protein
MAEAGEKRSPTAHRTPGQTLRQSRGYNHRPENIKKRSERNHNRREMEKQGRVHKGDGMAVDHIKPMAAGGGGSPKNLRVITGHANDVKNAKYNPRKGSK